MKTNSTMVRCVCNASGSLKACATCEHREAHWSGAEFIPANKAYSVRHTRPFQCPHLTAATFPVRLLEVMHATGV